jgi:predicted amidohydrolase
LTKLLHLSCLTQIYIASVAKFVHGVEQAHKRLAEIAQQYAITTFMANCIGPADGAECAGQSAVWNPQGKLVGQLDDTNEGILVLNTATQALTETMKLAER